MHLERRDLVNLNMYAMQYSWWLVADEQIYLEVMLVFMKYDYVSIFDSSLPSACCVNSLVKFDHVLQLLSTASAQFTA